VTPPAITIEGAACLHDGRAALDGVGGRLAPGSLTAVVGPNGAGKTTLLRAIAGLHPLSAGRIDRGGLGPGEIGLLPQASTLDRQFPIDCLGVVALGAWRRAGPFASLRGAETDRAAAALARVGLAGLERRSVGSLSTGQFQRVLFARLIVQDTPVLLLDEPTAAVDARTEAALLDIIAGWHEEGRTVVAVLHDLHVVQAHFPQTLLLARRAVAWGPTAISLSATNRGRARLQAEAWAAEGPAS
jgi:zinc/manganese transport system ATP-binding protein